jgi:hypothetical protein
MQRVAGRLRGAAWPIMTGALLGLAVTTMAIGRYFTWDEAVFFSQSGGLDGSRTPPLPLAASRGLGSPFLIRAIRVFVDGLAGVRLVWATVTVLLLVFAARRLRRHIGDRGALLFLGVYGTFWLVWAFASSFYAMLLAGVFTMIAVTFYLDLVADPARSNLWPVSIGFGTFMTAAFLMRPIETILSAIALVLHLLALNRGRLRARFGYFATSVGIVAVAFGLPYVIDSISRFGSLTARLRAGLDQGWPQGLRSNVLVYLEMWVGNFPGSTYDLPTWPRWIIHVGMVVAGAVIVRSLVRQARSFAPGPAGAFLAVAAAQFAFFLFWAGEVREKYHFVSMIFMVALLAWAVTRGGFSLRRRWKAIAALGLAVWFVAQLGLVSAYNEAWNIAGQRNERVAKTMRTLSDSGPCHAFVQSSRPQLALGSGCTTRSYGTWERAVELGAQSVDEGVPTFIYGPAKAATSPLPEGWTTVTVDGYGLSFWLPSEPDSES